VRFLLNAFLLVPSAALAETRNSGSTPTFNSVTNDRDLILQTIGGTVPTAVKSQQLP